jgi:hypothetical protein
MDAGTSELGNLGLKYGILFSGSGYDQHSLDMCPFKQLYLLIFLHIFLARAQTPAGTKKKQ